MLKLLLLVAPAAAWLTSCIDSANMSTCEFLPPGSTWISYYVNSAGGGPTSYLGVPCIEAYRWTVATSGATPISYQGLINTGAVGSLSQPNCLARDAWPYVTGSSSVFFEFGGASAGGSRWLGTPKNPGFTIAYDFPNNCSWPEDANPPLSYSTSSAHLFSQSCPFSWRYAAGSCSLLVGMWNGIQLDPDNGQPSVTIPIDMEITATGTMRFVGVQRVAHEIRCGAQVGNEIPYQWYNPTTQETGLGLAVLSSLSSLRTITYSFGCTTPRDVMPPPLWGRSWTYYEWALAEPPTATGASCSNNRNGRILPGQYERNQTLSEDFQIWWTVDSANSQIFMALEGQTTGWLAFGPSPDHQMVGTDLVMVGCGSPTLAPFIYDGFVETRGLGVPPLRDVDFGGRNDYALHCCRQVNGWTVVEYSRPLRAAQLAYDHAIGFGPVPVAFAMCSKSPLITGVPEQHDMVHSIAIVEFQEVVPYPSCAGPANSTRYCSLSTSLTLNTQLGNIFVKPNGEMSVTAKLVGERVNSLGALGVSVTDTATLLTVTADVISGTVTPSPPGCVAPPPPVPACVSFTDLVFPLLLTRAASGHVGSANGGFSLLGTAAEVHDMLLTSPITALCQNYTRYIVPNSLDRSFLWHKIAPNAAGLEPGCGARMPFGVPALASSDLATVESWIRQGAPLNCGCPVNFVDNVYEILQSSGGVGHVTSGSGGLSLAGSPSELYTRLLTQTPVAACPGYDRYVVAGRTDLSFLHLKIAAGTGDLPAGCGNRMPLGTSLSFQNLAIIESWISQGAVFSCDGTGPTNVPTNAAGSTNANPGATTSPNYTPSGPGASSSPGNGNDSVEAAANQPNPSLLLGLGLALLLTPFQ